MRRSLALSSLKARAFRDLIQVRREEDGLFPKDTMLRTRTKSNTNDDDTIRGGGESGSALRGSKGKHHSQRKKKHILNLCIGFAIVFILGAFFSLFVYDIEDLEEASAVSFRDDGKGTLDDERKKKKKRRNHEEKETEEAHSTRRRGSQVGSAVTPNARFDDVRSSFAQSFAALSKGGKRRIVSVPVRFRSFAIRSSLSCFSMTDVVALSSSYKTGSKCSCTKTFRKRSTRIYERNGDKCKDNGYANAEWKIPELIAKSEVYTPDPELADFYVVPLFPECYVRDKLEKGGADYVTAVRKVNKMYQAAIDRIAGNYPYWRRSEGRDHVFIFPAEKGAENVLNEKTLERIGKAIKIVGVPTFKSSLSSSGGEDSDGDGSSRVDSNSESLEEEEKEEEENNSAKAMATRRARYAFSPFRDIIVPPVRDSRDEAYALVKAEMENVFSARRKIRMHFRGKVVSEDDEFFGAGGSGSSSESGGSDTKTDSSNDGRRKSSSSSSFNVRRRAYEQLKGLKGVNVVIDESNTASSFEVTGGIETDKGRKNATFSSSSSCDRKCVLRECATRKRA